MNIDDGTTIFGEPPPIPNSSRPSWEAVIEDMQARDSFGRAKYKTPLQPGNGRNSLKDAYEEELDKVVYLKNAIEEQRRARILIESVLDRILGLPTDSDELIRELRKIIKAW